MTVDPAVVPGLLLLALELLALAAVGYVVARVALRQSDDRMALAQGLVIGPALWGLTANFLLHLVPGRAGALASWVLLLALAAGLAWHTSQVVRPRLRTAMVFVAVALVVFWAMLASRQLLHITDAETHLGLAAFIREGGWPPILSYNPGQPLLYHYGADLLIGLLAPPDGPDLPFTTELLGAHAWTGFALVVAMLLWRRGGWVGMLVLTPLLLTPGAWTLVGFVIPPPDILQVPVLAGLPAAGLRASLADLFWPEASLHWQTVYDASPPNIWKPPFVLAYALTIVVLTTATSRRPWSWPSALTLAALIGFTGLLSEEVALLTLALWGALEAGRIVQLRGRLATLARGRSLSVLRIGAFSSARPDAAKSFSTQPPAPRSRPRPNYRSERWTALLRAAVGPALATVLLAVGGGPISALVSGTPSGTHVGWIADPGSRLPFGTLLTSWPGGVGLLGLGVVPVGAVALLLGRRQRVVLALVAGAAVFMVAAIALQHPSSQFNVTRMDGHARNFALLALLLALGCRLSTLRPRWRYAAGALIVIFVTWPTVAGALRTFGLEVGHGVELANAQPGPRGRDPEFDTDRYFSGMGRHAMKHRVSEPVARYIRGQTAVNARILSPHPHDMTATTGRPNASGFTGLNHLLPRTGSEFLDATRYLEPAAVRRVGFEYLHAPDDWIARLPSRARQWLEEPRLFEPVARGDADALYRILPAFLRLDPEPAPQSFEALRRTIPESVTVGLIGLTGLDAARVASVLAHTQLLGNANRPGIHLVRDIPTMPLGSRVPDVVVVPEGSSSFFSAGIPERPPLWRSPVTIWRSHGLSAYATSSTIAPEINVPLQTARFGVRVSDVHSQADSITFTATFTDHAPSQWTGQDWLVIPLDDTSWALPTNVESDRYTLPGGTQWYSGQISPGRRVTTHSFEFNPNSASLAVMGANAEFAAAESSGARLTPGVWALTVRLRHGYRQAAVIPVLKVVISKAGDVSYRLYAGELSAAVTPCPEHLQDTHTCHQPVPGS